MATWRHSRKDVHNLLKDCERAGLEIHHANNQHFKIRRDGQIVCIVASSPKNSHHTVNAIRRDLRRAGIVV